MQSGDRAEMILLAIRDSTDPVLADLTSTQSSVAAGDTVDTPAPASYQRFGLLVGLSAGVESGDGVPPGGVPAGYTQITPQVAWRTPTEPTFSAGQWSYNGAADTLTDTLALGVVPATVWSGMESFALSNGQTQVVDLVLRDPTIFIQAPASGTDFTGAATVTAVLRDPQTARVTITATADGTVTLTQLRGVAQRLTPVETASSMNAASIAEHRPRRYAGRVHPYLSQQQAQALADRIVDHSAFPRRSWEVLLDADRNADTMAVCRAADVGQSIRTALDADFDHVGEVIGVKHRVSGPATLLETRLQLLAVETLLPAAHRLFLGSTANPMFLGSAANPLELR